VSRASNWSVAIDSCLSASFASDHYLSCENKSGHDKELPPGSVYSLIS
jgi:hypothetical protein